LFEQAIFVNRQLLQRTPIDNSSHRLLGIDYSCRSRPHRARQRRQSYDARCRSRPPRGGQPQCRAAQGARPCSGTRPSVGSRRSVHVWFPASHRTSGSRLPAGTTPEPSISQHLSCGAHSGKAASGARGRAWDSQMPIRSETALWADLDLVPDHRLATRQRLHERS
jgi:hypothetical protein